MRKSLFTALAAALLFLAGCDYQDFASTQRYQEDFHFSYPLTAGGRVSIETFNGAVEISGWDQETVDISGVKYGASQQAAEALRIDVDHAPDSVSIRAVRPSDRRIREGARFVIKVPRAAVLTRVITSNGPIRTIDGAGPARFRTSNAQIRVQDFSGNLDAQTSNGSVELAGVDGDAVVRTSNAKIRADRVLGMFEANTSNGGVDARIDGKGRSVRVETSNSSVDLTLPADFGNSLRASTSNGSITLHLPGQPNAQVLARTSNSSIRSDFDVRGENSKTRLDGTLGNGGPLFDLATSNGSIRLLRM